MVIYGRRGLKVAARSMPVGAIPLRFLFGKVERTQRINIKAFFGGLFHDPKFNPTIYLPMRLSARRAPLKVPRL